MASKAATTKKLRPARKQVEKGEIVHANQEQTGKEYNIWYNKWAGGDSREFNDKTLAQTRCFLARDAGYTRADAMGTKYCCLFFARGCCPLGVECTYLHRLPLPTHQLPDASLDCFAREKHADYRDDMGGVGSFERQNRTLYIGRISESGTRADTEEVIRRHFGEWGPIARINILHTRGVAFVTYETELNAQFAKEAMSNQSLDSSEILNVRWATADPNPTQIRAEKSRLEDLGKDAIKGKVDPKLAEASVVLQALEEGREEDLYDIGGEQQQKSTEASSSSTQAIEAPLTTSVEDEEGDGGAGDFLLPDEMDDSADEENDSSASPLSHQHESLILPAGGILDSDTLQGMKYFIDMKRKREEEVRNLPPAKKVASTTGGGITGLLGGYGSDEDED